MTTAVVWCESIGHRSRALAAGLAETLERSGYAPVLSEPSRPILAGILVCDALDATLGAVVIAQAKRSRGRVLLLCCGTTGIGDDAWRLLSLGAADVVSAHGAREISAVAIARLTRWRQVDEMLAAPAIRDHLIGESTAWLSTLRRLVEMACFAQSPVLIEGETGTGKELAARVLHSFDPRTPRKGLIVVDCGTISPELSGSEFFGHERGAFTGAASARDGAFAAADGGTLFLDEVGELPLSLQVELLRVVQERTYKRLGSNVWHRTSFRLVSATNRNLASEVEHHRFRSDLYYRLASLRITLPPLRERPEDILHLTRHFMGIHVGSDNLPGIDPAVESFLVRRRYPGNVRELEQLISRIMQRHVGSGPISVGDIPEDERPGEGFERQWQDEAFERSIRRAIVQRCELKEIGRVATDVAISIAVEVEGSLAAAAKRLGVTDRALQIRRAARRQSLSRTDDQAG